MKNPNIDEILTLKDCKEPINLTIDTIHHEIIEQTDKGILAKAMAVTGIDIDKRRMIRALNADNCIRAIADVLVRYGYAEKKGKEE